MELKKSKEANIEQMRIPLILIGGLFVGSLVLASFNYTVKELVNDGNQKDQAASAIQYQEEQVEDQPEPENTPPPEVDVPPPPAEEIVKEENKDVPPPPAPPTGPPPAPPGDQNKPVVKPEIVEFPDVEASFPGGAAAMQKWINDNIEYPQTAIEMGDQGRVFVSFVVGSDGSISQVKVERGVSDDLNDEAKRVVRRMPKWNAGEQAGKKVPTRCRLPISFTLQ